MYKIDKSTYFKEEIERYNLKHIECPCTYYSMYVMNERE